MPTTFDSNITTGYPALTFTTVGEVSSIGDFGPIYSTITFQNLTSRVVSKHKGSVDYGEFNVDAARDESDGGQALMDTALADDCEYAFKVDHNDEPCSGGSNATTEYFTGIVTRAQSTGLGGPDNVDGVSYTISITRAIVKVPAA